MLRSEVEEYNELGVDRPTENRFGMLPSVGRTFTFKGEISHPQKQKVMLDKLKQEGKHILSFILTYGCPDFYLRILIRRYLKGCVEHFVLLNSAHK